MLLLRLIEGTGGEGVKNAGRDGGPDVLVSPLGEGRAREDRHGPRDLPVLRRRDEVNRAFCSSFNEA
jgi:hypothetical protein